MLAKFGSSPISAVDTPIIMTVITSMRLRPRRSPKWPKTTPPSGRNRKPTPNVPKAASVPISGLTLGKNSVLKMSAATMPYRRKSYQSTTAPTKLPSAALRARFISLTGVAEAGTV